jgi:hypothetical protein
MTTLLKTASNEAPRPTIPVRTFDPQQFHGWGPRIGS